MNTTGFTPVAMAALIPSRSCGVVILRTLPSMVPMSPLKECMLFSQAASMELPLPSFAMHGTNRIPLARGLGSSSAAAVAGVVLARRWPS